MPVIIGEVTTFANPKTDKAQALKPLEEAAEVFGAWQAWQAWTRDGGEDIAQPFVNTIVDECADVITAVCNLVSALGVDDMRFEMKLCEERNRARGRL